MIPILQIRKTSSKEVKKLTTATEQVRRQGQPPASHQGKERADCQGDPTCPGDERSGVFSDRIDVLPVAIPPIPLLTHTHVLPQSLCVAPSPAASLTHTPIRPQVLHDHIPPQSSGPAHPRPGRHLFLDLTAHKHLKHSVQNWTQLPRKPPFSAHFPSQQRHQPAPGHMHQKPRAVLVSALSLPLHCFLCHLLSLLSVCLSLPPP